MRWQNLHLIANGEEWRSTTLSEIQNQFLYPIVFLDVYSMTLFSVTLGFSLLEIASAIISEALIQLGGPRITQPLATHYECSKQNNVRHFSFTRVQKSNQAPAEIEWTGTLASVFCFAKAKRIEAFRCFTTIQKTRVFCAQGAHDKKIRHDRMDYHNDSLPLSKELDPNDCKNAFRNFWYGQRWIEPIFLQWFFHVFCWTEFSSSSWRKNDRHSL